MCERAGVDATDVYRIECRLVELSSELAKLDEDDPAYQLVVDLHEIAYQLYLNYMLHCCAVRAVLI